MKIALYLDRHPLAKLSDSVVCPAWCFPRLQKQGEGAGAVTTLT